MVFTIRKLIDSYAELGLCGLQESCREVEAVISFLKPQVLSLLKLIKTLCLMGGSFCRVAACIKIVFVVLYNLEDLVEVGVHFQICVC